MEMSRSIEDRTVMRTEDAAYLRNSPPEDSESRPQRPLSVRPSYYNAMRDIGGKGMQE